MANVFTKRHHKPRTTTLRDFAAGFNSDMVSRNRRVLSPTRRQNPHPRGLVSQKAYNKDNATFLIWNPDSTTIARRMPEMMTHLNCQNFCSRPLKEPSNERKLPAIQYSMCTTMRTNYQWPSFPKATPHEQRTTRFGNRPTQYLTPVEGIVPATLPPISPPEADKPISNFF